MRYLREWALAIALYLAMVADGLASTYLGAYLTSGKIQAPIFIMPIGIMLIGLMDEYNSQEIWLGLGAGIIADLYFWGIIGIYAVFFPLAIWAGQKIARWLPELFITRLLVLLVGTSALTAYIWLILNFMKLAVVSVHSLLVNLVGNLIVTLIVAVLTYWIWFILVRDYPFRNDLRSYRY